MTIKAHRTLYRACRAAARWRRLQCLSSALPGRRTGVCWPRRTDHCVGRCRLSRPMPDRVVRVHVARFCALPCVTVGAAVAVSPSGPGLSPGLSPGHPRPVRAGPVGQRLIALGSQGRDDAAVAAVNRNRALCFGALSGEVMIPTGPCKTSRRRGPRASNPREPTSMTALSLFPTRPRE